MKQHRFVVHKHDATHLHYDLRLEADGVLKSWAVPKQPPLRAGIKRLATQTPDHKLSYIDFKGTIPEGEYGAGTVEIWDNGTYENVTMEKGKPVSFDQAYKDGKIEVWLEGEKLKGGYVLVKTHYEGRDDNWLLLKMKASTAKLKKPKK